MIQLDQAQLSAIKKGAPVRVRDTESGDTLVVCPVSLFERMEAQVREILEDEKEQEEWVETATQDLARRLEEDDDG